MKVDDIIKNRTPLLDPRPTDAADFAFLRERLQAVDFNWTGVEGLLGTSLVSFVEYPGYLWRCRRAATPLAKMVMLWLLGDKITRTDADEILTPEGVNVLLERRILREEGDEVASLVDLYPCEDAWVWTDHAFGVMRFKKHVYELGSDSYAIARMTPRKKVGQVLDLCTGSGIHAIMASRHSERATGVDISDRALNFSRVNAGLNDASAKTRYVMGDLYNAVRGEKFDLVIANPPWIATPNTNMELYRWGGETGEVITRGVVDGLPAHLNTGGTLSMFVIYPLIRGEVYLDRFRSWLPPTGWGVALAESTATTLENFIRLHLEAREDWGRYVQECATWMDAYDRHGIEAMGIGMAYVRRLPEGRPGWGAVRRMAMSPVQIGDLVERWIDDLERYHDPAWTPDWDGWKPALSDRIARIWRDVNSGEGRAEFSNVHWGEPVSLTPDELALAERLSGNETAGAIADGFEGGRARVADLLRSLGIKEIL